MNSVINIPNAKYNPEINSIVNFVSGLVFEIQKNIKLCFDEIKQNQQMINLVVNNLNVAQKNLQNQGYKFNNNFNSNSCESKYNFFIL